VTTPVGINNFGHAIVIQGDGKILAGGKAETQAVLARYLANGNLDTSFGGTSVVQTVFGTALEIRALTQQADGHILAAGNLFVGSNSRFAAMRYLVNGSLDPEFDTDGIATTTIDLDDEATAVALQRDGKILIAGNTWDGSFTDMAMVRFTTQGALDMGFGTSGVVRQDFASTQDEANPVAVQKDGKILLAGFLSLAGNWNLGLARYCALFAVAAPRGQAQGLFPLTLTGSALCGDMNTQFQWENLTSGQVYPLDQNPVAVDVLSETSWFELTVTDPISMVQNTTLAVILVHESGILDWNGDGCNSLDDLWEAIAFWNTAFPNDPNGDGIMDVRDFLYLNTSQTCP